MPDSEPIQQFRFRRKLPIPKEIQEKSRAKQARLGILPSKQYC
jgi:ubiquitin